MPTTSMSIPDMSTDPSGARARWTRFRALGLLLLATSLSSCSDPVSVPEPGPDPDDLAPHDSRAFAVAPGQAAFAALPGATAHFGTHVGIRGDAAYRIEVPDTWNGVLVMYAHGYRGTTPTLTVSSPPSALREHLVAKGYAWAASSYSANYYDVRAGVEDTNALALEFTTLTGRAAPTKHYVVGVSMGGHIAAALVEQETLERAASVVRYAAAMPMCGVVADNELSNYYYAFTIAARELAGLPVTSFPMTDHSARLAEVESALWVDYDADPFDLTPQGEKFKHAFMYLSGGPRPTFEEDFPRYLELLFDRGAGEGNWVGVFAGLTANTTGIEYQLDADPALSAEEVAFNSDVFRVEGDFLAQNPVRADGVRTMPILEGRLDAPVLSVHTLESRVPFRLQRIYAERTAARGNAPLLVQRVVRSGAHCDFTAQEWTDSFDALIDWEVTGTSPAGDDVLDEALVSDPTYGCTFTSETRPGMPPCP